MPTQLSPNLSPAKSHMMMLRLQIRQTDIHPCLPILLVLDLDTPLFALLDVLKLDCRWLSATAGCQY
jgi:hypothetical protein